MAKFQFDSTGVTPKKSFGLLADGDYTVIITDSELKATNAGTGHYLALTCEVTEGPAQGRKLWTNLNVDNPNEIAVRIARETLAAITSALGLVGIKEDTEELHNQPLVAVVKTEKNEQYGDKNTIATFKPCGGTQKSGSVEQQSPSVDTPQPTESNNAPAWMK